MLFQPVISTNYSILVLNISAFTISFTTDSHFSVKSMYLVVAEVVILNIHLQVNSLQRFNITQIMYNSE
ncbi:hypothetical protein WQ89_27110 [Escherichia coli]|nr:hypothetical protein WQ89_27110 [Escherichia coli]